MKYLTLSLIIILLTACSINPKPKEENPQTIIPVEPLQPQTLDIRSMGIKDNLRHRIIGAYYVEDPNQKVVAQLYIKWVYGFLHLMLNNQNLNQDIPSPATVRCELPNGDFVQSPAGKNISSLTQITYWHEPYIGLVKCKSL